MELLKQKGIILYLLILITHCVFIYFNLGIFRFYSKLLLVPLLICLYYINQTKSKNTIQFILPLVALLGSFLGDLLLAFEGAQFFLLGMLGFMITHICNSIYFNSLSALKIRKAKYAVITLILLMITCSFVVYLIKDNTGAFFVPIIVYMLLIAIMAILAANMADSPAYNYSGVHYFIPGAILFVLSDGLLAINKFNLQDPSMDVFVMITYGLAQLYLVMGYYKVRIQN